MKNIAAILEELRNNPEAHALLKGKDKPENAGDEAREYAEVAGKLGYDITAEEILDYTNEAMAKLRNRTDASAGSIEELPEDELSEVAGGGDHEECYDTYKDRENCWYSDGCDHIYQDYKHYVCKRSDYDPKCGKTHACDYTATCGADW